MNADKLAALYDLVKREPNEGTLAPAIKAHAQACGLVAYICDVHPDDVAQAVMHVRERV